jgi:hypothetical protein
MALLIAFGVLGLLLHWSSAYFDKPRELDPDIWDADPEKLARNLKLATEARRAGKPYMNPDVIESIYARHAAAQATPFASKDYEPPPIEPRPRRLVRRHMMDKPHWE